MGQGSPVTPVTPGDELDQASLQEGPPPWGHGGGEDSPWRARLPMTPSVPPPSLVLAGPLG